ncbi:MAG: dienelactone hydrolase family protein [Acidimicrobiia bacterium]|nr:dienelactone hydrolase family protein [Acidimicrobiia bacterium]
MLWATTQSAVKVAADYTARDTGKLIVGGRSMGGRYMSMVAAGDEEHAPTPVAGLLLAGYPLYPPGKPDNVRDAHFAAITCPTLFIQGTRDPMGSVDALTAAATGISGTVAWCWLPDADHGFKPRKSSGRSQSDCFVMAGDAAATWVQSQPR